MHKPQLVSCFVYRRQARERFRITVYVNDKEYKILLTHGILTHTDLLWNTFSTVFSQATSRFILD